MAYIGIGTCKPAEQIMDMLTGKADICILNPWFEFNGMQKPTLDEFLKETVSQNAFDNKTFKLASPKIVYNCAGVYKDVIFTEDCNESKPTTVCTFYKLYNRKVKTDVEYRAYYASIVKPLQKFTAKRANYEKNTTTHNECVINYQLTQAIELCLIFKYINTIKKELFVSIADTTDKAIIDRLKGLLQTNSELNEKLQKWVDFNYRPSSLNTPDMRFMYKYTNDALSYYDITENNDCDIIKILTSKLITISKPNTNIYYKYVKIQTRQSFCYPGTYNKKFYHVDDSTNAVTEGVISMTDYTFILPNSKFEQSRATKHLSRDTNGQQVDMTIDDHYNIAAKKILAKIYFKIDFDLRCASKEEQSAYYIRYKVLTLAHIPAPSNSNSVIDTNGIDLGFDDEDITSQTTTSVDINLNI